jgi:UDP-N-acetylglucosamine--dolichyl-phosphate N-acetylglucosaminephosphotransferase
MRCCFECYYIRVNPATGLLHPSTVHYEKLAKSWLACGEEGHIINFTLINLVLHVCGPLSERTLCTLLLALQVAACTFGFIVRYHFASMVYKR